MHGALDLVFVERDGQRRKAGRRFENVNSNC